MLKIYIIVCALMSFVALCFFGVDKSRAADGKRRIPEITLLTLATMGGGVGALLGKVLFNHKSNAKKKPHFAIVLPVSAVLQVAMLAYLLMLSL